MTSLTKAQRRVLAAVQHGAQLWLVADGDLEDPFEDPGAHYIVAEFVGDELAGTWRPQRRTLWELRRRGLIDYEGNV